MASNKRKENAVFNICGAGIFLLYITGFFLSLGLLIYIQINGYYKDLDDIPGLDERLLARNPLIRTITYNYEMVMGDVYMSGDRETSELLKKHKTRITSLAAVALTSNLKALVSDVEQNNGNCNAMCNHFNVVYNVAAGHLHMKGYIYFPEAMKQLKAPLKKIIAETVKNIQRNDALKSVEELHNAEIIQPVYDFFVE
ncbi:unnamed protein product [Bursaphelenchus xylophilus]|uniref:(pine wood nematode) hypothetical protein n=1 Tax=Bursaphelenchus xylophilus TaxID=6326 RepID=A0A1I7S9D4_BURXY|nr:unnamed protein product [Bursaphelenchus xylophilus]CAG9100539.1 unnamed protein product [Bursaphelenchus xylophilus]